MEGQRQGYLAGPLENSQDRGRNLKFQIALPVPSRAGNTLLDVFERIGGKAGLALAPKTKSEVLN